ncbi:MAG: N-acetyl-gamma-glutamyl-phosphate reductase [Candidatus Cryptobacteroides sp.]
MIRAGIIGAAGYTAGELLRILSVHPQAEVVFAQSSSHSGEPVWKVHQDLVGDTDLEFCSEPDYEAADCIFICSGHGKSKEAVHSFPPSYKGAIIDLSNDFRLDEDAEGFVYGLPEAFRSSIASSRRIANPGCFATAIQLALLPAAKAGILGEVHITGVTGSTGAGQKPSETTHFSWRDSNMSVYKPFTHQHLGEVRQTLRKLQEGFDADVNFIPMRGDFTRGIIVSAYFDCDLPEDGAVSLYEDYYRDEPFVVTVRENPDLKMVVNTAKCVIYPRKYRRKVHVVSLIDNLLKGASGQAVENMNIVFGLDEDTGLRLKASRF